MNSISDSELHRRHVMIAIWLFMVIAMVFAMVVLGGVTRLTHSGLSMVEWRPVTGWLPPMGEAEWTVVFDKYKLSPEFQKVNKHMDLAGFKAIFWFEFLHRLWGRLIGVVFFVPFVFFLLRGWLTRDLARKMLFMFVLGGLQGLMGWYMVKSGLVDRPDVSQYRLTAHFSLALIIIGVIEWVALGLLFNYRSQDGVTRPLKAFAFLIFGWAFVTALSGGFVAGLDAGFAYNTFPLMDGALLPPDLYQLSPVYLNLFEDILSVQFNHRILAEVLFVLVVVFWFKARNNDLTGRGRLAVNCLAAVVLVQMLLGITTLLLVIPVPLAAAHQAGAVIVFIAALWTARELS
ncbi:MAG: COX15/CtaA family protein [Rhodospirillaceae bacterium]|nr:COX15/CtaA family protein [Rhodospirillaceae bacterium]MBL6941045.1 COX15/CtaA family protein [Rhodospirillales bacterium]